MKVKFRITPPYTELRRAVEDLSRDAAILAAPCSLARETMLTRLVLFAAAKEQAVAWCSANPGADRAVIRGWLERDGGPRWWAETRHGFDLAGGRVYLCTHGGLEALPISLCNHLVLADAELAEDPIAWVAQHVRGTVRYLGCFPPPGTWLYGVAVVEPRIPVHRVTAAHALAGKAITTERLEAIESRLPEGQYRREYLGIYQEAERERRTSFSVFSRQRLQIRTKEGPVVPFVLRSAQRSYAALKLRKGREARARGLPERFLLLKYRRGGFTTLEQGQSYRLASTRENVQAVTLAHTAKATGQIFRIAQMMHRRDPRRPRLKGVGNARQLEFPDLNSVFFVGTAGGSGEGRGDTLQRVHGSEVSKWGKGPRRREFVNDLVVGLTEAASHGQVVLETTANGHEWFYETYKEAVARQNLWTPVFIPWYWDVTYRMSAGTFSAEELKDTLTEEEKFLVAEKGLNLSQLAWRRMKKRELKGLFRQEYPENDSECFLSVGQCYFDAGTVLDFLEVLPAYERKSLPSGYVAVWESPVPGEEYAGGIDTSEGVPGSDPCGGGIVHRRSGRQVAAWHGIFTPAELAKISMSMGRTYNDALLGVERNNHGHAVLGRMEEYGNLYYAADQRPGWVTSPLTRPIMLADLKEAVEEGYMTIRDQQLLDECLGFVKQTSGKYEGSPDDAVMKWAIAWQMRSCPSSTTSLVEIQI